jgi:hypothetical protein
MHLVSGAKAASVRDEPAGLTETAPALRWRGDGAGERGYYYGDDDDGTEK